MKEKIEERNVLSAYYGSKAFVKIKQCLEIGKMQCAFVDLENPKNFVDIYMEAEEFGAILMNSVKNGSLIKALVSEKEKGEQYPKAVWTSPVGGNATGNNGKPISRYFEISPAAKGEVLFTAFAFPAEQNSTGAFIKVKGSKALTTLRVPCTYNDLKILQYKWSFLEADYMGSKYTLANMKSDYSPAVDEEDKKESKPQNETKPKAGSKSEPKPTAAPKEEEEIPSVGTNLTKEAKTEAKVKVISLEALSEMQQIPNKPFKVCKVEADGTERRLVCKTDKFKDLKRLAEFERQLKTQVGKNQTLKFKGEVCEKGDDIYLIKFA